MTTTITDYLFLPCAHSFHKFHMVIFCPMSRIVSFHSSNCIDLLQFIIDHLRLLLSITYHYYYRPLTIIIIDHLRFLLSFIYDYDRPPPLATIIDHPPTCDYYRPPLAIIIDRPPLAIIIDHHLTIIIRPQSTLRLLLLVILSVWLFSWAFFPTFTTLPSSPPPSLPPSPPQH
jgi:hypothetical protein